MERLVNPAGAVGREWPAEFEEDTGEACKTSRRARVSSGGASARLMRHTRKRRRDGAERDAIDDAERVDGAGDAPRAARRNDDADYSDVARRRNVVPHA